MARDLEQFPKLAEWQPTGGYRSSMPVETGGGYLAKGSQNAMLTGSGKVNAFKGMTERPTQDGGIVMTNVAENYASLGQVSDVTAYGSVFNVYAALFYIGKGLLRLNGVSLLSTASAVLSLLIKRSGVYTDPLSGPWQAGLAQPSAPIIRAVTPPAGFTGKVNGVVSVVIWRIRSTTGAVSVRSEVSNIIGAVNQAVAVTLPLPDANGQDYWGIGVTRHAEGRVGSHFILTEVPETEVSQAITRTDIATNAASLDITSATGGFTSSHIGWVVNLTGGTPAVTHTSFVIAVPNANTLTLDAMPPATSTGVNMTLESGIGGTGRTVVIEWRDGDLVGKEFAPTRAFPPPEGLFAGALEDVVFVDGCYADAESSTSSTVRGTAIAPSEPGRPENYSPDSTIFTNDTPTALVKGDGVYWRFGRNSLNVIQYLGGAKPLSVETAWEGLGVEYQHNAGIGEGGRLYFWPNERGPMRLGEFGLPDGSFATDIADDLAHCTDAKKRVVGWDAKVQVVAFCYEKKIWPFFTALDAWGAPADLTGMIAGNVRSCVTENGQLLISDDLDNLYEYNIGTGSIMKVRTGWIQSPQGMDTVSMIIASARCDNTQPVTIDVYADGDESASVSSIQTTPTRTGYQRLPSVRPNIIDTESHAIQVTIESTTAQGDCGVESISTFGSGHSIVR